jgi:hypothetical protein
MNLKYLGDALDHWKGSVFEILQKANLLQNLQIDAMASDATEWKESDYKLFSKLLRVQRQQIIRHSVYLDNARARYFFEIPRDGDLFLDPDTGFQTCRVNEKDQRKYLVPSELCALMEHNKNRIIMVYQHVRARPTRERVEQVLDVLRNIQPEFSCASYESGTVALLFFSRIDRDRVKAIANYFYDFLGNHAKKRIGQWE